MNTGTKTPRILLVRYGAMGDIIHSLPAAAALRRAFPQAQLDWLVEERWQSLLDPSPDKLLDHVIAVNTFELRRNPGAAATRRILRSLIGGLRATHYDIAVDLQGAIKSALSCKLSGAGKVFGFTSPWVRERAASLFYSRQVSSPAHHIVEANLDLAAAVIATRSFSKEQFAAKFPLPAGDLQCLPANISSSLYAVMNPGAGWPSKQWPARHFSVLCDELWERHQLTSILNCGPGEVPLANQVRKACRQSEPIIFEGAIPAMIALLREARLMVGPDTGPLHLAAALGVPTVGIYGPTDPARNGPYGPAVRTLRAPGARTSHRRSEPSDGSMQAISPQMVLAAIENLLGRQPRH